MLVYEYVMTDFKLFFLYHPVPLHSKIVEKDTSIAKMIC